MATSMCEGCGVLLKECQCPLDLSSTRVSKRTDTNVGIRPDPPSALPSWLGYVRRGPADFKKLEADGDSRYETEYASFEEEGTTSEDKRSPGLADDESTRGQYAPSLPGGSRGPGSPRRQQGTRPWSQSRPVRPTLDPELRSPRDAFYYEVPGHNLYQTYHIARSR